VDKVRAFARCTFPVHCSMFSLDCCAPLPVHLLSLLRVGASSKVTAGAQQQERGGSAGSREDLWPGLWQARSMAPSCSAPCVAALGRPGDSLVRPKEPAWLPQRGKEHDHDQMQDHGNQQNPGNSDKAPLIAQTRTDAIRLG
jgi:hypothetical protein